ncbi:MAG: PASTA domain-containing protein [Bacteroidaceae bacterium]|nr:PASTA domain-containing protein [Bacteroidaceae bacterium]
MKQYFTGKKGLVFWLNVILAAGVLLAIPVGILYALGVYTHHGEKVEVPNLVGMPAFTAEEMLDESRLVAIVSDSDYVKVFPPGTVLSQVPKSGSEVKSGRIVYLTINRRGKAPVRMPDLIRNVTARIAENQLTQLGFHLAPNQYVEGEPEDLVIGIKQGIHNVYGGDMVSVDRALTLVVGAGIPLDTLEVDTFGIVDDGGFDIEL